MLNPNDLREIYAVQFGSFISYLVNRDNLLL